MKKLKVAAILIFVLFILPCSSFAETLLKLLVWDGYAPIKQVMEFEKAMSEKYGQKIRLEVNTKISDPNEFFDSIRSEEKGYDIISPSHNLIKDERFNYIAKKLIMEIDLNNIPNYKDLLPSLSKADYISEGGKIYGVPFAHGPYGIVYNTKYFDKAPDSLNVLWEEKNKGRYSVSSDYYEANIYLAAMAMGMKKEDLFDFDKLSASDEFSKKLRDLAQNAKSFWVGVDKPEDLQGLSLGTSWGFSLPELAKKGENWKMMNPKEGYTGWVDNFVISRNTTRDPLVKKLAEEWLNFVISPEYQAEVVVRGLGSDPVNIQTAKLLTKEEVEAHHLNNPEYFSKNRILWPVLTKRNRNGLKYLWDHAMKK